MQFPFERVPFLGGHVHFRGDNINIGKSYPQFASIGLQAARMNSSSGGQRLPLDGEKKKRDFDFITFGKIPSLKLTFFAPENGWLEY